MLRRTPDDPRLEITVARCRNLARPTAERAKRIPAPPPTSPGRERRKMAATPISLRIRVGRMRRKTIRMRLVRPDRGTIARAAKFRARHRAGQSSRNPNRRRRRIRGMLGLNPLAPRLHAPPRTRRDRKIGPRRREISRQRRNLGSLRLPKTGQRRRRPGRLPPRTSGSRRRRRRRRVRRPIRLSSTSPSLSRSGTRTKEVATTRATKTTRTTSISAKDSQHGADIHLSALTFSPGSLVRISPEFPICSQRAAQITIN